MTTFELQTRVRDDAGIVTVRGEVDIDTASALLDAARAVRAEHAPRRLVIDFSGVSFVDSSGLHALLELRAESKQDVFELELILPRTSDAWLAFETAGVLPLFGLEERDTA